MELRVELMRERLAKGEEIARCALRALFPQAIWLGPDDSGRFLWAVYAVDDEVLRSALFDDPAYRFSGVDVFQPVLEKSACVVAGARFDLYSAYTILVRAVPASVIATR